MENHLIQKLRVSILSLALVTVLVSCAKNREPTTTGGSVDIGERAAIMKTWASPCKQGDIEDLYVRHYLVFEAGQFREVNEYYSSSDCGDEVVARIVSRGELRYVEGFGDLGPTTYPYNLIYTESYAVALNDRGKVAFEHTQFCGVSAWAIGDRQQITTVVTVGVCPVYVTRTHYGLVKLREGKLYLAYAESEDSRPHDIDIDLDAYIVVSGRIFD